MSSSGNNCTQPSRPAASISDLLDFLVSGLSRGWGVQGSEHWALSRGARTITGIALPFEAGVVRFASIVRHAGAGVQARTQRIDMAMAKHVT